jgi:hypothetical protein
MGCGVNSVRGESRGYTQSAAMCNVELRAHTLSCPACIHLHTLAPHLHTTLFLKHVLSATEVCMHACGAPGMMSSVNSVGGCVGGRWERVGERSQLQRRCTGEGWLAHPGASVCSVVVVLRQHAWCNDLKSCCFRSSNVCVTQDARV